MIFPAIAGRRSAPLLLLALVIAIAGCGGQSSSVSGRVTLDGQPLEKGTVALYPSKPGPVATGQISNGAYTIMTGTDEGLAPGTYTATVEATQLIEPTPDNPEPLPKLLTPEIYRNKETSGLEVEVKPGANDIPLTLQSQ